MQPGNKVIADAAFSAESGNTDSAHDHAKRQKAEAAMRAVLTWPEFTFLEVHAAGDRAVDDHGYSYRLADQLLQRERRRGTIELCPHNKRRWRPVSA